MIAISPNWRRAMIAWPVGMLALATGCRSPRVAEVPAGPHLRVLTYNVNWGAPAPELAADIIRRSGADIVCLQETTPAIRSNAAQPQPP